MTPDDPAVDRTVILPRGDSAQPAVAPPQSAAPAAPRRDSHDMAGKLPPGTRLAEFEITGLVGEGGFGIVYLAHDHSLQRRVALKEYMPSLLARRAGAGGNQVQVRSERDRETFEAGRRSFINEARLLARFDHPALVKVYRFWEGNGTAYMVMPLLQGATLKEVLRVLPEPPGEAWLRALLAPLTEALLVIHAEQCCHRDIAPDNVMQLHGSGQWLLLDFGAARRVIGDRTQALTAILKPGYAPVEQYADIPGMRQGPWTDVYALAAVVHAAITGRTPPPAVGRLLNDTHVPLVQAAAGRYDARFLAAIDRALAVRPEQRTQSIGALRQELGLVDPRPDAVAALPPAAAPWPPAAALPNPGVGRSAPDGNNAVAGIFVGGVVLAALAAGSYALFAPAPAPATAALAPIAGAAASVPAVPPAAATAATVRAGIGQELIRVVQAATPGFQVTLRTNKARYRIGRDALSLTIASERAGFVYVFVHGADGMLVQLFPNADAPPLQIGKGQTLTLPDGAQYLTTTEPPGPEDLLVLVAAQQRDHGALGWRREGAVRVFLTDGAGGLLAQRAPGNSAAAGSVPLLAGRALCPPGGACDDAFGAALARVEIVR